VNEEEASARVRERRFDTTEVNLRTAAAVAWAVRAGWSREDFDKAVGAHWSAYADHLEVTYGLRPSEAAPPGGGRR
jgi:hypothetical protein